VPGIVVRRATARDLAAIVESLARDAGYDPDTVTFAPRVSTLVREEVTA